MIVEIIKVLTVPFGMLVIGLLLWYALVHGIDGAIFGVGATIIGGLGGFHLKGYLVKR